MSRLIKIVIVFITLIVTYGCAAQDIATENEKVEEKSIKPLVESPLNDLDEREFLKQYNALPDDHVFKVSKKISKSGEMSIREMKEETHISIDESDWVDLDTDDNIEYEISLKGLRFFQNLTILSLFDIYVADIQELSFVNNQDLIAFDCTFEESPDGSFPLPNKRDSEIILYGCNFKNLDFLSHMETLNAPLNLMNNDITDISALKKFKDQRIDIILNNNKITDISVFNEFTVPAKRIGLSGNQISDLSPLKHVLSKDTFLEIGDNSILDYSVIGDFMKNHYYKNNWNYVLSKKNDLFRIEKSAGYTLRINQKEVLETSGNPFIYFNTECGEKHTDNKRTADIPRPACNAVLFIKQCGGSAEYNVDEGILTCTFNGKEYVFRDFSFDVDCEGKTKKMMNSMKRMEGNIPYMAIEDMCNVFDLKYSEGEGKTINYSDAIGEGEIFDKFFTDEVGVSFHLSSE